MGFASNLDLTQWNLWWDLNRHPYLDLKAHVFRDLADTGDPDFFLGTGMRRDAETALRPSEEQIRGVIVPALLQTLEEEKNSEVVTGCMIALAKIGDVPGTHPERSLARAIEPFLAHRNQAIAEAATLALGILGSEGEVALLADLLHDGAAGRRLTDSTRVSERTRAFAAYALGLVGGRSEREDVRRYAVHHLARALDAAEGGSADLDVACVLAIGLVPLEPAPLQKRSRGAPALPASASRAGQLEHLLGYLADDGHDRRARAHAATSLGRLADDLEPGSHGGLRERIAEELLELAGPRSKAEREVVQSAVLALGQLGDADGDELDRRIRKLLTDTARRTGDGLTRNFAQISLAHVAGRDGAGEDPGSGVQAARKFLMDQLSRGKTLQRPWAGLAAGLLAYHRTMAGDHAGAAPLADALRFAVKDERSPVPLGAFSVAVGIARDAEGADAVHERLLETGDDWVQGYQALGLGLAGHRESTETLRELARDSEHLPARLSETSVALGLLGDKEAVPELMTMLQDAGSLATQASLSSALGLIGDSRTVHPLVDLHRDRDQSRGARAYAAVALGMIADKDPLPWSARLSGGVNYAAAPVTLYDAAGGGVLNIL